jgi:hypothetical protein
MQMSRAERRRLEIVADRIDTSGCDLCHVPLGGPVPHHFGRRRGKLVGVCGGCITRLDGRAVYSGVFDKPAPWQEDDRAWFEENRGRSYRLRLPVSQEVAAIELESGKACPPTPSGRRLAVAVGQRERGFRIRHIVFLDAPLSFYTEGDIERLMPNIANVAGRC